MEFKKYPDWEELDLTPRKASVSQKVNETIKSRQERLLEELKQEVEEIKYEACDFLEEENKLKQKKESTELELLWKVFLIFVVSLFVLYIFVTG